MRVIGEIPHPQYKITLFSWNGKYLLKLEAGPYEQTYKVSEAEAGNEEAMKALVNEDFLSSVTEIFKSMHTAKQKHLES